MLEFTSNNLESDEIWIHRNQQELELLGERLRRLTQRKVVLRNVNEDLAAQLQRLLNQRDTQIGAHGSFEGEKRDPGAWTGPSTRGRKQKEEQVSSRSKLGTLR